METPLPSLSQPTLNSTPAAAAVSTVISAVGKNLTLPQLIDGSPHAFATENGGIRDQLAAVSGVKLRLMCSFGGHIMPRPHDKVLTYSGGETRLVVIDRSAPLSSLRSRLSSMLLNGRSFTLKYQLPNEDLDSLITVTTDEDLENMIEEYDCATSSATATAMQRIRLFLFPNKLETAATMGSLLDGAKSDTWFIDALNQSGLPPRGLSDSAAVNNTLVNLDEASGRENGIQNLETNAGGQDNKRGDSVANGVITHQEMHMSSVPDSPVIEVAGSSIESASSSPSTSNLPLIRVRVSEDQRIEEQFAQMSFPNVHTQGHYEDDTGLMANRPTMIPPGAMTDSTMAYNNAPSDLATANNGHVLWEDDRSDPSVPTGYMKPPLPMQPIAIPPETGGGYVLTSPDSVASDTSISSATSFTKPMYYQEQAPTLPRAPVTQPETTSPQTSHVLPQTDTTSSPTASHVLPQPNTYTTMDQQHQLPVPQPFVHQGVHYIPFYSHQRPNSVFFMSVPQSQQYVPAGTPPLFPNSNPATNTRPEASQNIYRAPVPQNPPQVLQFQQQHQYMGYTGVPQHITNANANNGVPQHITNGNVNHVVGVPQHITNGNANHVAGVPQHITNANGNHGTGGGPQHITNANGGTGVPQHSTNANPQSGTVYYHAQPPAANIAAIQLASPYQTMTPTAAAAALTDMSKQMAIEGGSQQQHMAGSQPP